MKIEKFEDIIGWQKAKNLTLDVSQELGYTTKQDFDRLYALSVETSKLLSGFIKTL